MLGLHVCVYVYHVYAWPPGRSEEGIRSPGTGINGDYELPRGCWDLNPGLLQEQVLLAAEPSLQALPHIRAMGAKLRHPG